MVRVEKKDLEIILTWFLGLNCYTGTYAHFILTTFISQFVVEVVLFMSDQPVKIFSSLWCKLRRKVKQIQQLGLDQHSVCFNRAESIMASFWQLN